MCSMSGDDRAAASESETGASDHGARVAVISGGGSGIGREIALELARRGYALALLGRRLPALEATLAAAGLLGSQAALALSCDVRDEMAVAAAASAVEARWGAADLVVPAAGTAHIRPFEELSSDGFAATLDTNLTGAFFLLRALLPGMRRRRRGWIFAILSVAARRGFPGWAAYCASKAGLAGLLSALREELAGSGVRLTSIYPGATDTPIWEGVPGEWNRAAMVPPEDVARALGCALDADPRSLVEEIHLGPAGGSL
jgi:3-oxoacyl-[acyl-carrier protein] reductase